MSTPITSLTQLDPNGTYTYADYVTWQFEELVELLRGKVVRRQSTPAEPHQATVGHLFGAIGGFLRQQPCRARLSPYDVRLPMPNTIAGHAIHTEYSPISASSATPAKSSLAAAWVRPTLLWKCSRPAQWPAIGATSFLSTKKPA